jgi:hypothetical protein
MSEYTASKLQRRARSDISFRDFNNIFPESLGPSNESPKYLYTSKSHNPYARIGKDANVVSSNT